MPTSTKDTTKKLIPVLSKTEKQEISAYFNVHEKYAEELSKKAMENLKDHPVFGELIRNIPKEVSVANDKLSRELQKDAIMNDNWQPYVEYQIEQGIAYAKMGLDFKSWFEVIALVRNYLTPYLHQEYGSGAKLLSSLNGMNRFLDIAMGIIGEAYMQEKEGLIKEDREKIKKLNEELEQRVAQRTAQLDAINKELEAFSYSVSHDLRGPLRAIDGFSRILLQDYMDTLDDEGKRLLNIVSNNSRKMGQLIDDILSFSRVGRKEIGLSEINMEKLAKDVLGELKPDADGRKIEIVVKPLPNVHGDIPMIRQVLVNILSNAIKFTRPRASAYIEVGCNPNVLPSDKGDKSGFAENVYYVKDNGVGFDMTYASKLFGVFQRLHGVDEFEGTGIGLAIVKRVIDRHDGRVWAEGKVNEGATFYFALPKIILKN